MCGIAGWMTADGAAPDRAVLDRMADALAHRGPDGRGLRIHQDTGLVQTRLAIIDLDTGDQPIVGPEGSAIVANGEVYNYIELRDEIPDAPFTTRSDSEVPLHLYRRDGLAFADALRGMVALAIHDGGQLVLNRDPFGIKPLYVAEGGFGLLFASEPRALVASGLVAAATDDGALAEVAQLQFSCGARTPWAGIRRLLPGETLVVRAGR
ncbi:MAG: N-acetylglutaminylglutamine amidotransferase, partial [Rhodobacterales bacterium]|nr:N-acetylglutaminylglutamine amidotransferase [Rhodobacterales bacterium]